MTTRRPRIAKEATAKAPELNQPLNDALAAISARIDAIGGMRFVRVQPIEFTTGTSVAAGTAPLPLRIGVGGMPVVGLLVGRVENLTDSSAVITAAISLDWRLLTDGLLEVRFITGLSTSTRYRLHLVGVCNATG